MATFSARVLSITQDAYVPKVIDQTLDDNIFMFRQLSNGVPWRGERYKIPVMLSKNTNGSSYDGLDVLPSAQVETRQNMFYDPRAYSIGVTINGLEADVNNISDSQVLSLIETEMETAQISMADSLGTIFYSDGTGNGNKDFNGAGNLNDDGTVATNIGNLSRTTYPKLAGVKSPSGGQLSLLLVSQLLTATTRGSSLKQSPTILISDMAVWDFGEQLLQPAVRANYDANGYPMVSRNSKAPISGTAFKGSAGFKAIIYRGTPWVADMKSTPQTLWTFNERYLEWAGIQSKRHKAITFAKGTNIDSVYDEIPSGVTGFQQRDWMESQNQDAEVAYIFLKGNLMAKRPGGDGRLTGITSA